MITATIPQLSDLLNCIDLPVDWVGLRKSREIATARSARDGMPQNNSKTISEGVMVEVLVKSPEVSFQMRDVYFERKRVVCAEN